MSLLALPTSTLTLPLPWMSELCCPTALDPIYRAPHAFQIDAVGRSSPWMLAVGTQYALLHRGMAAGITAPENEAARDFMAYMVGAAIARVRHALVGDLQRWCALPPASRSECGPPCYGSGLEVDWPPVVCRRCGGWGIGEEREDGYGKIGGAVIDRRELAKIVSHLAPTERVDLGVDDGSDLWICGSTFRAWIIGLGPELVAPTLPDEVIA